MCLAERRLTAGRDLRKNRATVIKMQSQETNIKNQIINNYLSQQLMVQEKPIDVPSADELEDFKNCVRIWMEVDSNVKKLQTMIKERNVLKKEVTVKILSFMSRYNIEDLNTKEGKLRYKVTRVKAPLSQKDIKEKIQETMREPGITATDLTTKVFERQLVPKHTLKRVNNLV